MRISDWSSDVCSSDLTSWGPMRPPSGRRRVGRGALRARPFSTGPGLQPLEDLLTSLGEYLVARIDELRHVVRPSVIEPETEASIDDEAHLIPLAIPFTFYGLYIFTRLEAFKGG